MRLPRYGAAAWLIVALALSLGSAEASELQVGREATVQSIDGLNVRSEPHADAGVLTIAEGGDFVHVLDVAGSWYKVEYDGVVGWVSGSFLGAPRDRGAVSSRGNRRGDAVVTDNGVRLPVPYRSQLDGSAYAGANCGPTSIAMALQAFGKYVPTTDIRRIANRMQGTTGWYDAGTSLEVLAEIAASNGLVVRGLHAGRGYDRWSFDDVRRALRNGHVVIPQVHLATLPGQERSNRGIDHFIAIIGYEGGRFIYHDPAFVGGGGHSLSISEELLALAWKRSDFPFAAFSLGPGPGFEPLIAPPEPPARAATPEPTPEPIAVPGLDRERARAIFEQMLAAEAGWQHKTPQPNVPLAPVAAPPAPAAAAPAAATPVPAPPAPAAAPAPEPAPNRSWPLVLLAALVLALLGSRRVVRTGAAL